MKLKLTKLTVLAAGLHLALIVSKPSRAQDVDAMGEDSSIMPSSSSANAKADEDDDSIIRKPKEVAPPPPKEFSKAETLKVCTKYKDKIISVYGEMFKLQNCIRHHITDPDNVFLMTRQGAAVIEVESTDVAALPVGQTWESIKAKDRPCSAFNKKYVTFSYTDIYYVENCVRRLIPDYETLLAHRQERGQKNGEVLALTDKEFWSIRQGRDISSIIDKDFAKLMDGSAGVDIIPVDEACKGVEGKIVTFYSRMYKIEKCRKREIDAESFTMGRKLGDVKLIELKPEQWISMPDGKPFTFK